MTAEETCSLRCLGPGSCYLSDREESSIDAEPGLTFSRHQYFTVPTSFHAVNSERVEDTRCVMREQLKLPVETKLIREGSVVDTDRKQ
ncbi:hypothetical protein A6R68_08651 [Neotoma lepida]|uniref:Uncharacterized protein n=1 Tax=Neotoma lepida TaxID=56216 RepID=A0A1A6G304_NEOLE|nr:hypothetical protein A6R68_08651 [Neotoma lepida]